MSQSILKSLNILLGLVLALGPVALVRAQTPVQPAPAQPSNPATQQSAPQPGNPVTPNNPQPSSGQQITPVENPPAPGREAVPSQAPDQLLKVPEIAPGYKAGNIGEFCDRWGSKHDFAVTLDGDCQNVVNPLLDGTKYLPHSVSDANYGNYDDPTEIELYDRMLRETDFARQRDLMRQFEKWVLDTEAHEIFLLWRYRIVPYRRYVKGFRISPSHYINQDLATIWLDK